MQVLLLYLNLNELVHRSKIMDGVEPVSSDHFFFIMSWVNACPVPQAITILQEYLNVMHILCYDKIASLLILGKIELGRHERGVQKAISFCLPGPDKIFVFVRLFSCVPCALKDWFSLCEPARRSSIWTHAHTPFDMQLQSWLSCSLSTPAWVDILLLEVLQANACKEHSEESRKGCLGRLSLKH